MPNNKPELYLHVGYPKTGTSAIQCFCYENKDVLLKKGICYPDPHAVGLLKNHNKGHIYCCESLEKTNYALGNWRDIRQKYLDEMLANNCEINLLSSEQFVFEHSRNIEFWNQYFSLNGICYFRKFFSYINSLQKEFIKEFLRPDVFTFVQFRNIRILGSLKYLIRITPREREKWIFRSYDAISPTGCELIRDFVGILGVDNISGFVHVGDQNLTCHDALLTFIYQLSFIPFNYQEAYQLRKDITSMKLTDCEYFHNTFLPSKIFQLDSYAKWAINFQGELLNDPDWFEKTIEQGKELSRLSYHDLPPAIQYDIFDRLSDNSKDILRRFLNIPLSCRTVPFLPSMQNVESVLPAILPLYARYVALLGEKLKDQCNHIV